MKTEGVPDEEAGGHAKPTGKEKPKEPVVGKASQWLLNQSLEPIKAGMRLQSIQAKTALMESLWEQFKRLNEEKEKLEKNRHKLEERKGKMVSDLSSFDQLGEKGKAKAEKIAKEIAELEQRIKEIDNEYEQKSKDGNAIYERFMSLG